MDDTDRAPVPEEPTQSLRAWSQVDTQEVVEYRPRRWKIPAAAAVCVIAPVLLWPRSAGKPQLAPPKPQVTETQDQRFIRLLGEHHQEVVSPKLAVDAAHWACRQHDKTTPDLQIAQQLQAATPGATITGAGIFVDLAREVYCP